MISSLEEICDNQFGRHVILYLLSPRSSRHFSPQFVDLLTPGDGNEYSKKSATVRSQELLGGVAQPLVDMATKRACDWARSKSHAPLLLQIVESLKGMVQWSSVLHSKPCTVHCTLNVNVIIEGVNQVPP